MATGRLTWQNVAAPDFSGAAQTQSIAAEAMDRALGRVSGAITAFDNNRKDMADAAVLRNAMQYQNADQLQAAIASGALMNGVNPDHVRVDALLKAQAQAGNLMALDKDRQALATDKQTFEQRAALHPEELRNKVLTNDGVEYAATQLQAADKEAELIKLENQRADADWLKWIQSGQGDSIEGQNTLFSQLDNSPYGQRLGTHLRRIRGDLFTPVAAPAGVTGGPSTSALASIGAPSSTTPATTGAGYNTVIGGGQVELTGMPIGQWMSDVAPKLIAQTKGTDIMEPGVRDLGSSASGRYQFVSDTVKDIAPKVFGADWKNQPMDENAQEAMGKYLYDRRLSGKTKMTDEWRGLTKIKGADAVGAWDGIPWEAAKEVIAQFETSSASVLGKNPTMDDVRAFAAQYMANRPTVASGGVLSETAQAMDKVGTAALGGPRSERIIAATADGTALADVTTKAMERFKGFDQNDLAGYIEAVANKIKQPPAVAVELLADLVPDTSWFGFGKPKFSDKHIKAAVKNFNENYAGNLRTSVLNNELHKQRTAQAGELAKQITAQEAAVMALDAQAAQFADTPRQLPLLSQAAAARKKLNDMLARQSSQSTNTLATSRQALGQTQPPPPSDSAAGAAQTSAATPPPVTSTPGGFYGAEATQQRVEARRLREEAQAAANRSEPIPRNRFVDTSRFQAQREAIRNLTPERIASMTREEAQAVITAGHFPLLSAEQKRQIQSKLR